MSLRPSTALNATRCRTQHGRFRAFSRPWTIPANTHPASKLRWIPFLGLLGWLIVPQVGRAEIFEPMTWLDPDNSNDQITLYTGTAPKGGQNHQALAVGDLNGDSCDDLALAVQGDGGNITGQVWIIYGARQEWNTGTTSCSPPIASQVIDSEFADTGTSAQDDGFGYRLAISDVNADGVSDLAISAPYAVQSRPAGLTEVGAVYVFLGRKLDGLGRSDSLKASRAEITLRGTEEYEHVGQGLALAGDVLSADGSSGEAEDLWIGSMRDGTGHVFLLLGDSSWASGTQVADLASSDPEMQTFTFIGNVGAGSGFARQLATQWRGGVPFLVATDYQAHQVNSGYDGQVYRTKVEAGAIRDVSDATNVETFYGDQNMGSYLGYGIGLIPSSSEQGSDDALWIGAPYWGNYNKYWEELCGGGPNCLPPYRGKIYRPDSYADAFIDSDRAMYGSGIGQNIAVLPDLDRDGLPEVALGSPGFCSLQNIQEDDVSGRVYLARAADLNAGVFTPLASVSSRTAITVGSATNELPALDGWDSDSKNDCFGISLAGGDFNHDGLEDLAVVALTARSGQGTLSILWSISNLFDQDGDGTVAYLGVSGDVLTHESDISVTAGDCDDNDPLRYPPDATEECNGLDDDCDGDIDEEVVPTWYRDEDGDGHGTPSETRQSCEKPTGFVESYDDCNDFDEKVYLGANELCDGQDNNCDGKQTGEEDADGDGYRSCQGTDDCNDTNGTIYPGAPEMCDGEDNACNRSIPDDEFDADGDGWFPCEGDCDDVPGQGETIHPGASGASPGDDEGDVNCDGDTYQSVGFTDESSPKLERGCGAIQTNAAYALMLGPWLQLAWRRRRNGRHSEK